LKSDKNLMSEAAVLYYEKKFTQQEIAQIMNLSRQTVSKLLNDAQKEGIVEIKIHNPQADLSKLEKRIKELFSIEDVKICSVSANDNKLRRIMTAKLACEYILPYIKSGDKKIAVSWGQTVQAFIQEMPEIVTNGNTVFPLFGATERQQTYFLSNELARIFADKINAKTNFAWFPYKPDSQCDCDLFKKTTYYRNMEDNWNSIDIAIVGIGNKSAISLLGKSFGSDEEDDLAVGDIATHTFNINGELLPTYGNTLCVSSDSLRTAKKRLGIACGDNKVEAIIGALRSGLLSTLITDDYTAQKVLENIEADSSN